MPEREQVWVATRQLVGACEDTLSCVTVTKGTRLIQVKTHESNIEYRVIGLDLVVQLDRKRVSDDDEHPVNYLAPVDGIVKLEEWEGFSDWVSKLENDESSFKFFQNRSCEFFPCKKTTRLNCLFCFCPLYHMDDCGGKFVILDNGWKDCTECLLPHSPNGHDYIMEKLRQHYDRGLK